MATAAQGLISKLLLPERVARHLADDDTLVAAVAANPTTSPQLRSELATRKLPASAAEVLFWPRHPDWSKAQIQDDAEAFLRHERRTVPVRWALHDVGFAPLIALHDQGQRPRYNREVSKVLLAKGPRPLAAVWAADTDENLASRWWINHQQAPSDTVVEVLSAATRRRPDGGWVPREVPALLLRGRHHDTVRRLAPLVSYDMLLRFAVGRLDTAAAEAIASRLRGDRDGTADRPQGQLDGVAAELVANPTVAEPLAAEVAGWALDGDNLNLPGGRFDPVTVTDQDLIGWLAGVSRDRQAPSSWRWAQAGLLLNPAATESHRKLLRRVFGRKEDREAWLGLTSRRVEAMMRRESAERSLDTDDDIGCQVRFTDMPVLVAPVGSRRGYRAAMTPRMFTVCDRFDDTLRPHQLSLAADPYQPVSRQAAVLLGDDLASWTLLATLADGWAGTVGDLIAATAALQPDAAPAR